MTDEIYDMLFAQKNNFILRNVAGAYWLVYTAQPGYPFRPPLKLNDSGARIWELFCEGRTIPELGSLIAEEDYPEEEAANDVADFLSEIWKGVI